MNCNSEKVITLKDICSILKRNKVWFLITFIVVVLAGLGFAYTYPYLYGMESYIKINKGYEYGESIVEKFPDKVEELWLYEDSEMIINDIEGTIKSDNFLQDLKSQLSFNIGIDELKESIYIYKKKDGVLNIKAIYNDEQKALEILQRTVFLVQNIKRNEMFLAYDGLMDEIDKYIEESDYENNGLITARNNLVKNKDKINIGFVGELRKKQGVDDLIMALDRIGELRDIFNVILIGDGPYKSNLKEIVVSKNLNRKIKFLGYKKRDLIPKLINEFDIGFVGKKHNKTNMLYDSPLKMYEYMAMAKPVIASKTDDAMKVIKLGRTGFLYEPGNIQFLADVLEKVILAKRDLKVMGLQARKEVEKNHSWQARTKILLDKLNSLGLLNGS
jgi:glycosyltransferase involved in cell wall biosynthesis